MRRNHDGSDATRLYRCYGASGFILREPFGVQNNLPIVRTQPVDRRSHVPVVLEPQRKKRGRPSHRSRSFLWAD